MLGTHPPISLLKRCSSAMLMGVISLAVQCGTTLVVSLYRLDLFSYRVMGEKADPFVGGSNSAVGLASGRAVGYYLAGGGGRIVWWCFPSC